MVNNPSIAFVGWNPFQFIHISDLAKKIPGCVFVIEKRKNNLDEFDSEFLDKSPIPIMIWDQAKMDKLDGIFDIIICQTPFFRIETFSITKIVMIQYGYAKEPHNYGAWRSLADLCITYGDYAKSKIEHFCPAISTGNPRFDKWLEKPTENKIKSKTHSEKQTLLYVPTWGDLSSFDLYIDAVLALSDYYNIIIKLHHNSDIIEKKRKTLECNNDVKINGANSDIIELIHQSDIVISDYSGAIFDAVFFSKPIILLDIPLEDKMGKGKIDSDSLEFSHRSQLGFIIDNPSQLFSAVEHVNKNKISTIELYSELKKDLFTANINSCEHTISQINKYWLGNKTITQQHAYTRKIQQELLATKRDLNIALKKIKN